MFEKAKKKLKEMEFFGKILRYRDYLKKGKDHRGYVGGKWDEVGKLQFDFMVANGLKPEHVFLDVACGSLRGGRFFIPYLDSGNYLGIDHNKWLIKTGLKKELSFGMKTKKKPTFVVSSKFEFHEFSKKPDFALAISLFTHLCENDILLCLSNLKKIMKPNGKFFVSFNNQENAPYTNPNNSGDAQHFRYTIKEMKSFGERTGWECVFIGDWKHPRNQQMMKYYIKL